MVAGIGLHPSLIFLGPLGQDLLRNRLYAKHVPIEVRQLLRSRQPKQVPVDDNPVETVVYKKTSRLPNSLLKSSIGHLLRNLQSNKIIGQRTDAVKISNIFG